MESHEWLLEDLPGQCRLTIELWLHKIARHCKLIFLASGEEAAGVRQAGIVGHFAFAFFGPWEAWTQNHSLQSILNTRSDSF